MIITHLRQTVLAGALEARVVIGDVVGGLRLSVTDEGAPERGSPDDLADSVGAAGETPSTT
jgi:hypothetical protein